MHTIMLMVFKYQVLGISFLFASFSYWSSTNMGRLGDHLLISSNDRASAPVIGIQCNSTDGGTYTCNIGHCCENNECCSHYYELWWFWLIWSAAILLSCCCLYHQRQKRYQRNHQHRVRTRRHKEAYEGVCNYPGPPLENKVLGSAKLPGYKDVIRIPPSSSPPPPYSSRRKSIHTIACLQPNDRGETSMSIIHCNITASMLSVASLSHYIPELLAQNSIEPVLPITYKEDKTMDSNNNNTQLKFINERVDTSSYSESYCEHCDKDSPDSPLLAHSGFEDPNNNNIPAKSLYSSDPNQFEVTPQHCGDPSCRLLRHQSEGASPSTSHHSHDDIVVREQ